MLLTTSLVASCGWFGSKGESSTPTASKCPDPPPQEIRYVPSSSPTCVNIPPPRELPIEACDDLLDYSAGSCVRRMAARELDNLAALRRWRDLVKLLCDLK